VRPVREWLEALGLPQFAEAFAANDIDLELLPRLSDQVRKDIGVKSAGHGSGCSMPLRGFPSRARRRRRLPGGSVATPSHGERRQATVLVVDISGYTGLCARLDAEQVQALVKRFYDETDRIVVGYGGHVIDHAGDGTLAVFGAPVAQLCVPGTHRPGRKAAGAARAPRRPRPRAQRATRHDGAGASAR
jgi:class 3 adenylate cyclase